MTSDSDNQLRFRSLHIRTSNEIKGNFIRLPSHIVQTLENTGVIIQEFGISILQNGKNVLHVGWDGYESQSYMSGQATVEINPVLAQSVGIPIGSAIDITVGRYGSSRMAEEVYVEPETSDDWEIIETHSQFFQEEMLHQTRIVAIDETLFCYVDNVTCRFKIKKIIPESLRSARINNGSLIAVAPRVAASRVQKAPAHSRTLSTTTSVDQLNRPDVAIKRSMYNFTGMNDQNMRISVNSSEIKSQFSFVSILQNALDIKHQGKYGKQETNLKITRKIAVAVEGRDDIPKGHVAMTPIVWDALWFQAQNGYKVVIEFLKEEKSDTAASQIMVVLRPFAKSDKAKPIARTNKQKESRASQEEKTMPQAVLDIIQKFKDGPLTDKMALQKEQLFLEIVDENTGRHIPYVRCVKPKDLKWSFRAAHEANVSILSVPHQHGGLDITRIDDFLPNEVTKQIMEHLLMPVTASSAVVLTAGTGMGKTTVLKELALELSNHARYVNYTDCNTLSDIENLGKMKQFIQELCSQCYWHRPSIILLDNAETLFPSNKTDDPQQQALQQSGGITAAKLALYFINLVESISKKSSEAIRVVLTAPDKSQLNNLLYNKHFICQSFKKSSPSVDERGKMIQFFIKNLDDKLQLSNQVQYRDIALETDCYSPLDLRILVDKLFHQSITKMDPKGGSIVLDKETYMDTLRTFSPTSLRGVKLTRSTGVNWNNIGALKGPKRVLLETLEWPTKYAPIFQNCPLQLRSGILLYGFPGCGKTMLASAVAQQCGLNFITVNGPEILNKYIGASEQNVRELFERAQSVKPCILFFDEFDSIAPKRGHDSTGVTDRIVNQLLTQMDGVEGRDGVYVLAATSRPDLIDSALLRPGRIDKSVLCNIPDHNDRLDILQMITSSGQMTLKPGTDLGPIASQTAGYSGADLHGLCYNAYLKSVHRELQSQDTVQDSKSKMSQVEYSVINAKNDDILPNLSDEKQDQRSKTSRTAKNIAISLQDLIEACQETKPSISTSEYKKLHAVYVKFQSDREGDMIGNESSSEVGTRTSLM
ncbi:hypothetical protein HG536_0G04490 [Torulaspora globosa]|uniref:Peroxisomal ATPase PEX1 n=1 Tax=Torulaspora globosa TaxID=48254 RepID=A0A7G3ZM51_9SACH|nr:uncharacterized protein HG536_0G04490 [Torulaspora globosa]QLL34587.1 hypothetical protein HG536_0G04490 [Torulaspora globosa]